MKRGNLPSFVANARADAYWLPGGYVKAPFQCPEITSAAVLMGKRNFLYLWGALTLRNRHHPMVVSKTEVVMSIDCQATP